MKKIFTIALAMFVFVSCANSQVPAKKMTKAEINQAMRALIEQLQAIPEGEGEEAKACELTLKFISDNKNEAGVAALCNILPQVMGKKDLIEFVNADEYFKADSLVMKNMKMWEKQMSTGAGTMFVDFKAEYEGKTTSLSDYVGKGKYVLVDFWASWCSPCRKEIPNIIKVWEKYKGEKFEVLGVATWDKPEATIKAIEQLGIKYPQMLNAQTAGSEAYGIEGIPEIILFSPDGTIVARGLRGDKIESTVEEVLK